MWKKDLSFRSNVFFLLCPILIASAFFNDLLLFRSAGNKVQLTEITFLLLLPFAPVLEIIKFNWKQNRGLIIIVIAYLFFDLLSSVLSRHLAAIIESIGRCYLFAVFAMLFYFFSRFTKRLLLEKLLNIFVSCALLIAFIAIIGYVEVLLKGRSRFIYPASTYPYFGKVYRFRGPSIYPSMMISLAIMLFAGLLGLTVKAQFKKKAVPALFLIGTCAALTLSKSLLLLGLIIFVFFLKRNNWLGKKILIASTLAFALLLETFTHVIFHKSADLPAVIEPTKYTSGHVLYRDASLAILETDYLNLKRIELDILSNHLFFGTGTGNFSNSLPAYVQKGSLPARYVNYDPHSTYLGALAENGIFAALLLLAFFGYLFWKFCKEPTLLIDDFLLSLFLIYICFLIDAICTDILNFRHLWVFIALAVTYLDLLKTNKAAVGVGSEPDF